MKQLNIIDASKIQNAHDYTKVMLNKILKDSNLPIAIFITTDLCKNILEKILNYTDLETDLGKDNTKLIAEAIYVKYKPSFLLEEITDECLRISEDEYCLDSLFIDEINNITVENKEEKSMYIMDKLSKLSNRLNMTTTIFKNLEEI